MYMQWETNDDEWINGDYAVKAANGSEAGQR
jgi:hypothetical protein